MAEAIKPTHALEKRLRLVRAGLVVKTDSVTPSSPMLELVRALASERSRRTHKLTDRKSRTDPAKSTRDLKNLRVRLTDLVGEIDLGDRQAVLQIRRPLLQEIVTWEFGTDIVRDPGYGRMIDAIEQAIDADPRMADRLRMLIRHLKRS